MVNNMAQFTRNWQALCMIDRKWFFFAELPGCSAPINGQRHNMMDAKINIIAKW
jgi:hypothetical protein